MCTMRRRAWVVWIVLFSVVIGEAAAGAVDVGSASPARPIAHVEVIPRAAIVGSPMELRITILVPTWFTSAPDYPSFEVAGLIVRRPPNSSHNVRETIDGVVYAGIVREYQLYPQRAATYLLKDLVVNVEYAHPDTRKPLEVALKIRPIRFEGTIPTPAYSLDPFLATSRLVLEQSTEGASDELEVSYSGGRGDFGSPCLSAESTERGFARSRGRPHDRSSYGVGDVCDRGARRPHAASIRSTMVESSDG